MREELEKSSQRIGAAERRDRPVLPKKEPGPVSKIGNLGEDPEMRYTPGVACKELKRQKDALRKRHGTLLLGFRSRNSLFPFDHLTQITNVHETPASSASGRTAPSSGVGHLCPQMFTRVRYGQNCLQDGGCTGSGGREDLGSLLLGDRNESLNYFGIELGSATRQKASDSFCVW